MNKDYADFVDNLVDKHEDRLDAMLVRLERDIALLASQAPTKDGELFDLAWAVSARQQIKTSFDVILLQGITELYDGDFTDLSNLNYSTLNDIKAFTRLPPEVLVQLKRQKFTGFEEIANTYIDTIATDMYQYTLVGGNREEMIQRLRGHINGVYQASDQDEIEQLVEQAKSDDPKVSEQAINKLHSAYGSDRLGNNLRRYANVYVRDAVNEMNAELTIANAMEAEIEQFKYDGSNINDTREFCRTHKGKTYSMDEINEIWQGDWKGKKAGSPFIVRGGWNCRHYWTPVV